MTRLETNYEIGPDVDVCQLVHTEQQRTLMDESGLAVARPDADIEFSRPGGYPELLELIKAHGYDLARRRRELPPREEVAADWYDNVFTPGVAALRRESLPEAYLYKTDADLFLWVYQRRRALRVLAPDADFDVAARDARGQRVSRRFRKQFLREKSTPAAGARLVGCVCAVEDDRSPRAGVDVQGEHIRPRIVADRVEHPSLMPNVGVYMLRIDRGAR